MKKRVFGMWLLAGALVGALCATTAGATVVDKDSPYTGDYFIAYNDRIGYYQSIDTGPMPANLLPAEETANIAAYSAPAVIPVTEEDRAGYWIEPQNLDELVKPPKRAVRPISLLPESIPMYGDERVFITVDVTTNESAETIFVLRYSGEKCNVWLEKDDQHNITPEMVTELGMEYDVKIHNQVTQALGNAYDRNEDGKMAILLYDIQDGYNPPSNRSYVGGFFMSGDLAGEDFNCMDVLHIDTYPSIQGGDLSEVKSTMVHELQHLIEASYCIENKCAELPLWVNEGLSMAAEHMFYGVLDDRIEYYNEYVPNSWPLFMWNDPDPLPNYSLSYLFLQYLRAQTKDFTGGGEELFRYIIQSENRTALCVEKAMKQFYPYISLNDILRNFNIALTLNEPTGLYGFAGETDFDAVQPKLYDSTSGYSLGNGAAVVKRMSAGSHVPEEDPLGYISYAAFTPGVNEVDSPRASVLSGEVYKFKTVSLSCCERYATIYYTLDGSEPTAENGLVYTGKPIQLLSDTTLKAVTVTPDGNRSDVTTYEYTVAPEELELFRRTVGAGYEVNGYGVTAAPDGSGVVMVGSVLTQATGGEDLYELTGKGVSGYSGQTYIVKYDLNGTMEWQDTLGGTMNDAGFYGVTAVKDGYVAVGYLNRNTQKHTGDFEALGVSDGEGIGYGLMAKYDWNGNLLWIKVFPFHQGGGNARRMAALFRVAPHPDGGLVAVGVEDCDSTAAQMSYRSIYPDYPGRAVVVRVNDQGDLLWKTTLSGQGVDVFRGVAVLEDGTVIAAGYSGGNSFDTGDWEGYSAPGGNSTDSTADAIIVALDAQDGDIRWKKGFGGSKIDGFFEITALPDGGFVAVGYSQGGGAGDLAEQANYGHQVGLAVCFDDDGEVRWTRLLNDGYNASYNRNHYFPGVSVAEDGVMVLLSSIYSGYHFLEDLDGLTPISQQRDAVLLKYDLQGNLVWKQNYNSTFLPSYGDIEGFALASLGNRRYAVCGKARFFSDSINIDNHAFLFTCYDESIPYYTVSGNVGMPGVNVGGRISDSQGNYSLRIMEGESVTLTPFLEGYTFEPASITVGPVTADTPEQSFVPTEIKYTLSGTIVDKDGQPLAGVSIGGVTTDGEGHYQLTVRPGVTVLLEPSLDGYTFEPAQITLPTVEGDADDLNFRQPRPYYTVSGKVTRGGVGQGGVQVGDALTTPDGAYSLTVEEGTELTLTPRFRHYGFSPDHVTITVTSHVEQNFEMLLFALELYPGDVDFGSVEAGYEPIAPQTFMVKNEGETTYSGLTVTLSQDSGFTLTDLTDHELMGEGSATFTVAPKEGLEVGVYTDTITLSCDQLSKTVQVRFEVTAAPEPPVEDACPGCDGNVCACAPGECQCGEACACESCKGKEEGGDPEPPVEDECPGCDGNVCACAPGACQCGEACACESCKGKEEGGDPGKDDPDDPGKDDPNDPGKDDPNDPGKDDPDDPGKEEPGDNSDDDSDDSDDDSAGSSSGSSSGSSGGSGAQSPTKPSEGSSSPVHESYINGYEDGTFRPDASLTRSQCTAMLVRLLPGFEADKSYSLNAFSDVEAGRWDLSYIAFAHQRGIANGYPDGTFHPDAPITRGEFSALVRNALGLETPGDGPRFSDIETHWAYYPIAQLAQEGVVNGYPDGTFRPDAPITRAEAVAMLNRAYGRTPCLELSASLNFSDVAGNHWAYWDIVEASLRHEETQSHR